MQVKEVKCTAELIAEVHRTRERTLRAMEELETAATNARETVSYVTWWRFLGYDPAATDFLKKLDMPK